ncbi:hypothetical protein FA95DRAFT_1499122 [Auriscalpium vulgare]|uniref:Uncharacterized protein n=1 Tax=Auriscalpium vulgare TaxID=40419 RepID=A0ACB8RGF2_9AGAM|nr:hypothetical protein FA95DRAFT_1499122 [Auriscalpium vulgare]
MEDNFGVERGSYIWGRSVHNTRIERLWYDVTNGFGRKWKRFFLDLEVNAGLNPSSPAHIWLLHFLFLQAINQDAQDWAEAWNSHRLQRRGEHRASPRELFIFGMVCEGPRGIHHLLQRRQEEEGVRDLADYGVDWEAANDVQLMEHLLEHNPHESAADLHMPFASGTTPSQLSDVPCEPPSCPLLPDQIAVLRNRLSEVADVGSSNMLVRRIVWQEALILCQTIF